MLDSLRYGIVIIVFYISITLVSVLLIINVVTMFLQCSQPDPTRGLITDMTLMSMNETSIAMNAKAISYLPEYYNKFYSDEKKNKMCRPNYHVGSNCFKKVYWILCNVLLKNGHYINYLNNKNKIYSFDDVVKSSFVHRNVNLLDDNIVLLIEKFIKENNK